MKPLEASSHAQQLTDAMSSYEGLHELSQTNAIVKNMRTMAEINGWSLEEMLVETVKALASFGELLMSEQINREITKIQNSDPYRPIKKPPVRPTPSPLRTPRDGKF